MTVDSQGHQTTKRGRLHNRTNKGEGPGRGYNNRYKPSTYQTGSNNTRKELTGQTPHTHEPSKERAQVSGGHMYERERQINQEFIAAGQQHKDTKKLAEAIKGRRIKSPTKRRRK